MDSKKDLLIEIGIEDLPARLLLSLSKEFGELICTQLQSAELYFSDHEIYCTPRRLAIVVNGLDTKQKEQLASQNKHYQKLLTLKAEDMSKPAHKEGDKLRSAMMHTIMKSTGYKTLQSAFLAQLKEINQRVCTKN